MVWTDGACEQDGAQQDVGFLIAVPLPGAPRTDPPASAAHLRRWYTWYHGAGALPQGLRERFLVRKQYIGQDELVGALTPYLSLPGLFGEAKVLHFIDNTAALAGLTKGYSRVVDSAHIVHAFHAWNVAIGAHVWFEYVRSEANPSDEPSRNLELAATLWEVAPGVTSRPAPMRFPSLEELENPAGWMREARSAGFAL